MAPKKGQASKCQSIFPPGWEWLQDIQGPIQIESITEANLKNCYLFQASKCEKSACRTNCKKNPNCHNGLGEKFWFGEIQDAFWIDIEDPEEQRKQEGSHVGLKNLGATCYVNTFLQLWFHNPAFQSAIFKWVPPEGYNFSKNDEMNPVDSIEYNDEKCNNKLKKADIKENLLPALRTFPLPTFGQSTADNICGNLQLLFALMKYSNKRFVDPSPFVQSLGLQKDEQQDAQEFSKLFMSLLEDRLFKQESNVKNLVQDQFGGKYAYVTRCSKCGRCSKNESRFYELDLNIQGHSLLTECIKDFLKEEKLEGENKYFCNSCLQKQDATRKIVLQSLPPVLNLQLLRFVFDRNTGSKNKCNSVLKFPEILDMNNFVQLDDSTQGIYELTAVLIHVGNSASSGHYVALILDKKDETWYKFNDERVDTLQGKKLQLGAEDESDGFDVTGRPIKRVKTPKGIHSSKNAYMLVYSRKSVPEQSEPDTRPADEVLDYVVKENSLLDSWIENGNSIMEKKIEEGRDMQRYLQLIYNSLCPTEDNDSEWLMTEWLRRLFNEKSTDVPSIDNSSLMCRHGRLDPTNLSYSKRISTKTGNTLFKKYSGFPRFRIDSLCHKCVLDRCRKYQFDAQLEKDKKFLSSAVKINDNPDDGFWVGKASLKQWKQLAINSQRFEFSEEDTSLSSPEDSGDVTLNDCNDSINTEANLQSLKPEETDVAEEGHDLSQNQSTADKQNSCKRKNEEMPTENEAKLPKIESLKSCCVSEDVTNGDCITKSVIGPSQSDNSQSKSRLFNRDILCSEHGKLCLDEGKRRIVSAEVWNRMKYYFKDCPEFSANESGCLECEIEIARKKERREFLRSIANEMRSSLTDLYSNINRPTPNITETFEIYVVYKYTLGGWRSFVKYARDPAYDLIENSELICDHGNLLYNADDFLNPRPEEIFTLVSKDEWELLCNYFPCDKEIFMINIPPSDDNSEGITSVIPECCYECRFARLNQDFESGKEFYYAAIYVRLMLKEEMDNDKSITNDENMTSVSESSKQTACTNEDTEQKNKKSSKKKKFENLTKGSRQSSRHRSQKGEYIFRVDSTQTLLEFKVKICPTFSVLPMDQHLYLEKNGEPLEGDKETLGDLRVRPGCVLLLRADEPSENLPVFEEVTSNGERKLEEGFKGTGLYGAF